MVKYIDSTSIFEDEIEFVAAELLIVTFPVCFVEALRDYLNGINLLKAKRGGGFYLWVCTTDPKISFFEIKSDRARAVVEADRLL